MKGLFKGIVIAILILTATGAGQAEEYELAPGPYTIENLGSPLQSNTQEHQIMFRANDGSRHLIMYYDVNEIWKYPIQLLDINLETGEHRLVDTVLGRPGPSGTLFYPANGKLYMGSGDPGYLFEYDPITGASRSIGKLHPTENRYAQTLNIGDDGWIYIGEYFARGGGLARYRSTIE